MSDQQQEPQAVLDVTGEHLADGIAPFVHDLGGPVAVTAWTAAGDRVGYLMANPISDDEVEVILLPDIAYARLLAVPAPEDDDPDSD